MLCSTRYPTSCRTSEVLNAGYALDVASKMDVDFAGETTELAKGQILAQAGTAMLAQANAQGQGMLALIQS